MYVDIRGKLVESKAITIEPVGAAMKDYVIKKFNTGSKITETQVILLRDRVLDMESIIKEGQFVEDEDILMFAKYIEIEFKYESTILSDIVQAIFYLSDGSSNNKLIALEQIKSTIDITLIEVLKARANRNNRCFLYVED